MSLLHQDDAYAKPPVALRNLYKKYQKHPESLESDLQLEIVDFRRGLTAAQQTDIRVVGTISKERLTSTFDAFVLEPDPPDHERRITSTAISDAAIFEHRDLPGGIFDRLNRLTADEW